MDKIKAMLAVLIISAIFLPGCAAEPAETTEEPAVTTEQPAVTPEEAGEAENETRDEEEVMETLIMKINDETVSVEWEYNESVRALAELAADGPVTIETSRYGGFEQVGSIGTTLPSNDVSISTEPGDIMLYTSSNIVVFFGTNSWSYTRLGRITGKSDEELTQLLGGSNATITITKAQ